MLVLRMFVLLLFAGTALLADNDLQKPIVSAGSYHNLVLKQDGTLWSWGSNTVGQLGIGDTTNRNFPIRVGNDNDWVAISAGGAHSLAIKEDGTLWAWGSNSYGELGQGDEGSGTERHTPVRVGTDTDWQKVFSNTFVSFALKTDGSLWAWGHNGFGQLGLGDWGTEAHRSHPVRIGADTDWSVIAPGPFHVIAVKNDGSLWGWGMNYFGQLGQGTSGLLTDLYVPTRIGLQDDWAIASASAGGSFAIKTNGSLWAWGNNSGGQLGLGHTTSRTTPTQVGADLDWTHISAGGASVAKKSDGSLWAWGDNTYGQLSQANNLNLSTYRSPSRIGQRYDWRGAHIGGEHMIVFKTDNSLWSWGRNNHGQLGLGSSVDRNYPGEILTASDWSILPAEEIADNGSTEEDGAEDGKEDDSANEESTAEQSPDGQNEQSGSGGGGCSISPDGRGDHIVFMILALAILLKGTSWLKRRLI